MSSITSQKTNSVNRHSHNPIWASKSKDDSEMISRSSVMFKRYGVKRVSVLKLLPSRVMSRAYGAINQYHLPKSARLLLYGAWSWFFKVKLNEIEHPLTHYENLTAFFTRRLLDGVRPIDPRPNVMVSPVDGAVVSVSSDMDLQGMLSQVKGIEYHISDFLGIDVPKVKPGNALFSAVIYLSPGDYHRFHSPTEWNAVSRTHIAGQLLPVNPLLVRVLPSLFCTNERVAVFGDWEHGFYSYTAVGATNVGSIRLSFDDSVVTNSSSHDWHCGFSVTESIGLAKRKKDVFTHPKYLDSKTYDSPISLKRGDDVGLFQLGSTIVLIFEAPKSFRFTVKGGDKVCVGQPIGGIFPGVPSQELSQQQPTAVDEKSSEPDGWGPEKESTASLGSRAASLLGSVALYSASALKSTLLLRPLPTFANYRLGARPSGRAPRAGNKVVEDLFLSVVEAADNTETEQTETESESVDESSSTKEEATRGRSAHRTHPDRSPGALVNRNKKGGDGRSGGNRRARAHSAFAILQTESSHLALDTTDPTSEAIQPSNMRDFVLQYSSLTTGYKDLLVSSKTARLSEQKQEMTRKQAQWPEQATLSARHGLIASALEHLEHLERKEASRYSNGYEEDSEQEEKVLSQHARVMELQPFSGLSTTAGADFDDEDDFHTCLPMDGEFLAERVEDMRLVDLEIERMESIKALAAERDGVFPFSAVDSLIAMDSSSS